MNKPQLPDFIQNKIDHYIENYFDINKNGKHLVLGKQASPDDIILQSNDYLALANHPLIKARLAKSLLEEQQSLFMSASFLQNDYDKPMIEKRLAKLTGFDECLLSQSGWNANVGLLQTICQPIRMFTLIFSRTCRYGKGHATPMLRRILLCIITVTIYVC